MTRGLSVHSDSVTGVASGVSGSESLLMFAQCSGGRKASSWDRSRSAASCATFIFILSYREVINPSIHLINSNAERAKEEHRVTGQSKRKKKGYSIIVTHLVSMFLDNITGLPAGFS